MTPVGVFDLFKIGIGPSSSHTVGPMRAARSFAEQLDATGMATTTVRVELFGSLGATGHGHGTPKAIILGLSGERPESVDPDGAEELVAAVRRSGRLALLGRRSIEFDGSADLVMRPRDRLTRHVNGMRFTALDVHGKRTLTREYFSIGGGFVVANDDFADDAAVEVPLPWPFEDAQQLITICDRNGWRFSDVVWANERASRPVGEIRRELLRIWQVMRACVRRGCSRTGMLPGGLGVRYRSAALSRALESAGDDRARDSEWLMLWALAVNEENAAGGRVVTAPTNGAAGVVPAVLHYYDRFVPGANEDGVVRFLLAAAAVGSLCKQNASISGAEIGCQGEIGSACAMAAAGLTEVLGGSPRQTENAAEIAIEHNLGLTCDPVGGLVQIPCIERNAIAAVKALTAARLAMHGDGTHRVSLDQAIATMRQTGRDMMTIYKETSLGGLAVNVTEC